MEQPTTEQTAAAQAKAADLARRRKADFDFLILCQLKNNMGIYRLMRDKTLDNEGSAT